MIDSGNFGRQLERNKCAKFRGVSRSCWERDKEYRMKHLWDRRRQNRIEVRVRRVLLWEEEKSLQTRTIDAEKFRGLSSMFNCDSWPMKLNFWSARCVNESETHKGNTAIQVCYKEISYNWNFEKERLCPWLRAGNRFKDISLKSKRPTPKLLKRRFKMSYRLLVGRRKLSEKPDETRAKCIFN